jgi:hypothetical protein
VVNVQNGGLVMVVLQQAQEDVWFNFSVFVFV